jgi:hypothetical protein
MGVTRQFVSYENWKQNPFPIHAHDLFRDMPLELFITDWMSMQDEATGEMVPFKLWPKQRELCRWIEATKVGLVAKGRQLGGSEVFSAYINKILVSEKKAEILVFSRSEDDAKYFLERRVASKMRAWPHVHLNGVEMVIWPKIQIETFVAATGIGAKASVLSSNPDAGSGMTVRFVLLDEMEKLPFAAQNWTAVEPTTEKNPRGQLFGLSSGQKAGTYFKEKLKTVHDYNIQENAAVNPAKAHPISLFFMPWHADPLRDQAWYRKTRLKYDNDVDMKATHPDTIEDLFLSKQGKVFPHFDPQNGGRHVWDFEEKLGMGRLRGMDLLTAYDPGFVHPAAFLVSFYDRFADILYIFDEIVVRQTELPVIGGMIKDKMDALGLPPKTNLADTALFKRGGVGGKKTEGDVLNQVTGMRFKGAAKADANGSRELLSRRLAEKKIVFHPRCQVTIKQMQDWLYDDNGVPVDVGDDCIDDLRYLCAEVWPDKKAPPKEPPNKDYDPTRPNGPAGDGRLLRRLEQYDTPLPAGAGRFGYLAY